MIMSRVLDAMGIPSQMLVPGRIGFFLKNSQAKMASFLPPGLAPYKKYFLKSKGKLSLCA